MARRTREPLSLAEFRSARAVRHFCSFAPFLRSLSPADRRATVAAINDLSIQTTAITRVLRRVGFKGTYQVISSHRRGRCRECAEAGVSAKAQAQQQ